MVILRWGKKTNLVIFNQYYHQIYCITMVLMALTRFRGHAVTG